MSFDQIVERLSNINLYYYMNEAVNILHPDQCPHILRLNLALKHLFSTIHERMQENGYDNVCAEIMENYKALCAASFTLEESETMGRSRRQLVQESEDLDATFYARAGLGEVWSDLVMPPFMERFLSEYVSSELHNFIPGLMGTDTQAKSIPVGAYAIIYHDLGDLKLIFRKRRNAYAFAQGYPANHSSFARWTEKGWAGME